MKELVPPGQNSMENWSIVGPKFSGGPDQFAMKILVSRTKIFVTGQYFTYIQCRLFKRVDFVNLENLVNRVIEVVIILFISFSWNTTK